MSMTFCKTCGVVIEYGDQCDECDEDVAMAADIEFADWQLDAARDRAWDDYKERGDEPWELKDAY